MEASSHRPPVSGGEESLIDIVWLASLLEESTETADVENKTPSPKIQKVPRKLGQVDSNKKCYVPSVVSIGPYHHGTEDLAAVEKLKPKIAREFATQYGKTASDISNKLGAISCLARNCYTEGSTDSFDDNAFAKMMFLDGCFILHIVHGKVNGNRTSIKMKRDMLAYVQRDLFLLENQLPFLVLEALMSFMTFEEQDGGVKMLSLFVELTRALPPPYIKEMWIRSQNQKLQQEENPSPVHLLDLLHQQLILKRAIPTICQLTKPSDWYSYRSVSELKATGIHVKASKTGRLTDVEYEPGFMSGNVRLPRMTIDDSTKSILLNLVAYESCPDTPDSSAVTAYICFMDSLINSTDDVREMISKGIVLNYLSDDHQVVELFHDLAKDLVPNPLLYDSVKAMIEKYHKLRVVIWVRGWIHVHFRTPWTLLAFVVSIATLVQTYFSAFPSKW